jgi:hypothetical protein
LVNRLVAKEVTRKGFFSARITWGIPLLIREAKRAETRHRFAEAAHALNFFLRWASREMGVVRFPIPGHPAG